MKNFLNFFFWVSVVSAIISCANRLPQTVYEPVPYEIGVPVFPDSLNIPKDNPMTVDGVRLGRYLFYDTRLSGNPEKPMSCATCHKQEHSFECGTDTFEDGRPIGNSGKKTPNVMLPLINLVWNNSGYFWNGFVNKESGKNIETTVPMAITAPHEMDGDTAKTVRLIKKDPFYRELFYRAFGTANIDINLISKAIAQFVRSLVSFSSRFDRFMAGEVQLTKSEMRGLMLFTTEGADCFHCHGSPALPLWTTNLFMNNAKDIDFENQNDRSKVTHNPMDKGKYRVPTLRNIEFTAPYMHDGRFKTLDEVLEFYNNGLKRSPYIDPLSINANHGGMHLTDKDLADLKAFLLTLSDTAFIHDRRFSNPWQVSAPPTPPETQTSGRAVERQ
jgi:cytochrome c peroxidase